MDWACVYDVNGELESWGQPWRAAWRSGDELEEARALIWLRKVHLSARLMTRARTRTADAAGAPIN